MASVTSVRDSARVQVRRVRSRTRLRRHLYRYLLMLPALSFVFFFSYLPLPGIAVAFMDYNVFKGFRSPWVGLTHFTNLFRLPMFAEAILNTVLTSLLLIAFAFPVPIIFALLLNDLKGGFFKRFVQSASYLPHFLSWISVIGIVHVLYALHGPLNDLKVALFGGERIMLLAQQGFFLPNVVLLSIWQGFGWSSIIYLAALTSINPELYEAAAIDGANRWQRTYHISVPGIMPTAIILLILQFGGLFGANFELIYGLQNPFISFEVIPTVVFKHGIQQGNYSMATAIGFFQGIVAFVLIVLANKFAGLVSEVSIW